MKKISRLLIAYDGSECSDAMLQDLRRAGLPAAVEAVVATIAYVFIPDNEVNETISGPAAAMVRPSQLRATEAVKSALAMAQEAAVRISQDFPGWSVRAEAEGGTPAWELLQMANRLDVDLITIGSHGHSTVGGRLILGSVSQAVLYDASCPVRVARCGERRSDGPIRILVGFDGSAHAEPALNAVTLRTWPPGTEVRSISVGKMAGQSIGVAEERLRAAGLVASEVNLDGDAATVLVQEAEKWRADTIFVGARHVHGFQHLLHGSVSAAVAARAHCSVEVVRFGGGATGK
ncbi:MAG TPA: universal stress protein [Pyrinomonadaceae bacterium]|nr:universal stress protein [Pyrinomonadaceae bacterium]